MTYRFTVAEKWTDDEWFMELDPAMKCLFNYMCDMCDCCGVWKVNFKQASFSVGAVFDRQSAQKALKDKIVILSNDKWFMPSFIKVQYPGLLSFSNSAHRGVIKKLNFHNIESRPYLAPTKTLVSPLVGAKDKDKDKDSSIPLSLLNSPSYTNSALKIDNVIQLFNDKCAGKGKISYCRGLSGKNIQEFLTTTSFEDFRIINTWQEIFDKTADSEFLTGQQSGSNFVATLNWLVIHDNALKVLNGQYGNSKSKNAFKGNLEHREVPQLSDHQINLLKQAGQI
jgi:hypothetical protein